MSDDEKWMQWYREHTDQRFDKLEEKMDSLIKFKWQIMGGFGVIGVIVSVVVQLLTK